MSSLSTQALHLRAQQWLTEGRRAMLVTVISSKGSTPRDVGTHMLVAVDEVQGTVGGGHLEWLAIDLAQQAMTESLPAMPANWQRTFPLGPALGQCCGGIVTLHFAALSDAAMSAWPQPHSDLHIELHGAGHVGQAIIKLLCDLDCTVRWIDMRESARSDLPPHITWLPSDTPEYEVKQAPPDAYHLVLTHRHDLDLRIIEAVLRRGDAAFAGLIGSQTKRASFLHKLECKGLTPTQLDQLTCPIGIPGLSDKAPAVIAIATVAQLLQHHLNKPFGCG